MLKPQELLRSGLMEVLEQIPEAGLRLVHSGPLLRPSKMDPDFSDVIRFFGDKWNKAGEAADYQMVASVESKSLKKWRLEQEFSIGRDKKDETGFFAAKAFVDPLDPDSYYTWKMGPFVPEKAVLKRMAIVIAEQVLPWLALCRKPENFLQAGGRASFMELALMQGKRSLASQIAQLQINERAERKAAYFQKTGKDLDEEQGLKSSSLEELCRWSQGDRNLLARVRMHQLDVQWPGIL